MIYTRLQSTASRLISNYGWLATFHRVTRGEYNPSTGSYEETDCEYEKYVVRDNYSVAERTDSAVQDNDIRLIAEYGDYSIDDMITIDGDKYRIYRADPITPSQTNCCYILDVRK